MLTELQHRIDSAVRLCDREGIAADWTRIYLLTGAPELRELARATAELTASGAIARVDGPQGPEFVAVDIDALMAEVDEYLLYVGDEA